MTIGICDDEISYVDFIKNIIELYDDEHEINIIIKEYNSGEELLECKQDIKDMDVVFLDINMKNNDGIKTAEKIRECKGNIFIVFVSSYIEYSIEGYKVNAVRYILKDEPNRTRASIYECMDAIIKNMESTSKSHNITYKFIGGERTVNISNIMYIESYMHKITLYMDEQNHKSYSLYERLDNIEKRIKQKEFCRINKSTLVNMNYIRQYVGEEIIMTDDRILHVPRAKNKRIREQYTLFKASGIYIGS